MRYKDSVEAFPSLAVGKVFFLIHVKCFPHTARLLRKVYLS